MYTEEDDVLEAPAEAEEVVETAPAVPELPETAPDAYPGDPVEEAVAYPGEPVDDRVHDSIYWKFLDKLEGDFRVRLLLFFVSLLRSIVRFLQHMIGLMVVRTRQRLHSIRKLKTSISNLYILNCYSTIH